MMKRMMGLMEITSGEMIWDDHGKFRETIAGDGEGSLLGWVSD